MSYRLAIVGGGPLCTYALERLAALLREASLVEDLKISVFERSGQFGAGVPHSDSQPPTSYMNRVAGQIAFAADECSVDQSELLPSSMRPTFIEWCQARHHETRDPQFDLDPRDVPRRFLHGLALRDMFSRYVALLRSIDGVTVELKPLEVTDVKANDKEDTAFEVHAGGDWIPADRILFATGHSRNRFQPGSNQARLRQHARDSRQARYVIHPYPLDEELTFEVVPPGSVVGVLGLGLTAIDISLFLTEGRGGRFERSSDSEFSYIPSGQEPSSIIGVGPSGRLPSCRPDNLKITGTELEHRGVFLTTDAVGRLRESAGVPTTFPDGETVRQLDFDCQVFPLIILEMAYVYYRTLLGELFAKEIQKAVSRAYLEFLNDPPTSQAIGIDWLLQPVQDRFDAAVQWGLKATGVENRFDWHAILNPLPEDRFCSDELWREQTIEVLRRDIENAAEGNLRNPVKAACDGVWRDLRGVLSSAVDYGGLTAESQKSFVTTHLRYYNQLSNGPGLEAMQKVLALIEGGLLDISIGPAPTVTPSQDEPCFQIQGLHTGVVRHAGVLVEGRMHSFHAADDATTLYPNLLGRGIVRMWRNPGPTADQDFVPGGLDLTYDSNPISRNGKVDPRLTFLGAPAEGVRSFQLSVARPRSASDVLRHVSRWADGIVADVSSGSSKVVVRD